MNPGILAQAVLVVLVRAVVVQDHVQFLVLWGFGDELIHKGQAVRAGFGGAGRAVNMPGGHLPRRK